MTWTVLWTPRANREAERASVWWAKNRPLAPDLLVDEVEEANRVLEHAPEVGAPHSVPGTRRLVLRKTHYLIFYSIDFESRRVRVLSLWSSQRKQGPRLRGL